MFSSLKCRNLVAKLGLQPEWFLPAQYNFGNVLYLKTKDEDIHASVAASINMLKQSS